MAATPARRPTTRPDPTRPDPTLPRADRPSPVPGRPAVPGEPPSATPGGPTPGGQAPGAPGAPAVVAPARRPAVARAPRPGRSRKVQARRVRRVIRRIDVWTVLKLSFLFWLCICLVLLIAGVVLWNIASAFDVINNVQKFIKSLFDLQTFTLRPKVILEAGAAASVVVVLLGTGANVLASVLYNLMSDVIGGIQVIVLEDETEA